MEYDITNDDLVLTGDNEFDEVLRNNISRQVIVKNGYIINNVRFIGNSEEQKKLDEIFLTRLNAGVNINKFICWVSKDALKTSVDNFIAGSNKFNMMRIVPFLDKNELKKLATKIIDEDGYNGLYFNSLIPFLDKFFIKKVVKDFINN